MSGYTLPRPIEILLIEDNPGDVRLTRESLKDAKVLNKLNVCIDGIEAMKYLKQEDEYANVPRPDLVLLDLNLPKRSGREVLKGIKESPNLKSIPVIILTTSDAVDDIEKAYSLGANSYLTKPVRLDDFLRCMRAVEDFWLTYVKFPPHQN